MKDKPTGPGRCLSSPHLADLIRAYITELRNRGYTVELGLKSMNPLFVEDVHIYRVEREIL